MEILTLLASASNVYEIVGELTEYARDINPDIAREAVKAVGRIALSVSHLQQWGARHTMPPSHLRIACIMTTSACYWWFRRSGMLALTANFFLWCFRCLTSTAWSSGC